MIITNGKLKKEFKRGEKLNDSAFMGIMRWELFNRLNNIYSDKLVENTYGYITKNKRITNDLEKSHRIDALCITGNIVVDKAKEYYIMQKVRCHNRQIHKTNILKGGKRKLNSIPGKVQGYNLYDKVKYEEKEYFIFGKRKSGFFDIRDLSGNKVKNGSVSCKKLQLVERAKNILTRKEVAGL